MAQTQILFPPGRLVMGSLYKPREKDAEGKPLTIKSGPNAGQPRTEFSFLVAIPKKPGETSWAQADWGAKLYQIGAAAFPQIHQAPTFSWKVKDGDSAIPNRRGKKPCDNEGWKGHWIVPFSSSYPPRIYKQENGAWVQMPDDGHVKAGYWVQVNGTSGGNNSTQQPGIYVNHGMVAFLGYDREIVTGPDVNEVGFATGLPAGVGSAVPVGVATMPGQPLLDFAALATPAAPGQPVAAPVMPVMPGQPVVQAQPVAAPVAAPTYVTPNPAILAVPVVPQAAPVRQMLPAAQGIPYADYIAKGWNDALLVQHGLMAA